MGIHRINRFATLVFALCLMTQASNATAQPSQYVSAEQQAALVDQLLQQRVEQLLPQLMRRAEIDMWVLISREYNEDPVLRTLLPSDWFSARRRTILVFFDRGIDASGVDHGVEALAVARYDVGNVFRKAWNPEQQPNQWQALQAIISERQPKRIGINTSTDFAQADGLTLTDYRELMLNLKPEQSERLVSAEALAVGWLETRIAEEIPHYQRAVSMAHEIIAEGFSNAVVQVGETTTSDIEWWFLNAIQQRGLSAWFPPTVTLQRQGNKTPRLSNQVVQAGDLLHVDLGLTYLRLNTDTQQHAYVLPRGQSAAPASLQHALQNGNQLQDILTAQFAVGLTGNQVLAQARTKALSAQLRPLIYSHPIGYYGHGSGPTIGMWDNQGETKGSGDYPLFANTAYSIELSNTTYSESWQQDVVIMLEEDAFFDGERVQYLNGRQESFHLIRE